VPGRDQAPQADGRASDAGPDRLDLDGVPRDAFDLVEFTDEELTQLALDADPFDPFDPEVHPFDGDRRGSLPLLPEWYMPAPGVARGRTRTAVLLALAVALVTINVGGFCVTYGVPEFVWKW